MRRSLLVPAPPLRVALSTSAFGQSSTRSTRTNPQLQDNTYNTHDQQKARAQRRQKFRCSKRIQILLVEIPTSMPPSCGCL
jgi:hypothetical protein